MDVYQQYFTILLYASCVGLRLLFWVIPLEKARSYDGKYYLFSHPIFIFATQYSVQFCMGSYFLAQWAVLKIRRKERLTSSEDAHGHIQRITAGNLNFKFRIFILPATFQYIGFACYLVGHTLTKIGTSEALAGLNILMIPVLCRLTLRMKFHEHYWRGAILVFLGYTLVAAGQRIDQDGRRYVHGSLLVRNTSGTNLTSIEEFINTPEGIFTGCTILIIGAFATVTYQIMMQHYMQSLDIPPLVASSCLGFFGTTLSFATMIPAYYIRMKPFSSNPDGSFENLKSVYYKLMDNTTLLGHVIGASAVFAVYISTFVILLKEMNALTTEIVYFSSSSIFITIKMFNSDYRNSLHWLVGVGGFIIIIGSLVYFDLVINYIFDWCSKQAQCGEVENTEQRLHRIFSEDSEEQLQRKNGPVNTLRLRDLIMYY